MTQIFDQYVDTTGLTCPEPVMLLHKAMRAVAAGEIVKVVATDPSTERDIPKFCQFLGHELLGQPSLDGELSEAGERLFCYLIRKKQD